MEYYIKRHLDGGKPYIYHGWDNVSNKPRLYWNLCYTNKDEYPRVYKSRKTAERIAERIDNYLSVKFPRFSEYKCEVVEVGTLTDCKPKKQSL